MHRTEFGARNRWRWQKPGAEAKDGEPNVLGSVALLEAAKEFVTQIDNFVASKEKGARVLTHKIGKIRVSCQSGECSIAVIEFTRVYTAGGGKRMHVPMRATALMKYELARRTRRQPVASARCRR